MTRIDRILELDCDNVDGADVYFLMRIAREALVVADGEPLNELFRILDEKDEIDSPGMTDMMVEPESIGAVYSGQDMIGDPGPWEATVEPEYEIEIIDQGFEPGTYGGWTVQFRAIGAPRLSYQKQDPILEAFVKLETAPQDAPKLGSGGSTALVRASNGPDIGAVMMAGGPEGGILRGFTGAALVEAAPVVYGNAPVAMPSDEKIAEACSRSLRAHLEAVKAEKARLEITETVEQSVVGKRLKVRG